jgi:hypothetical protein
MTAETSLDRRARRSADSAHRLCQSHGKAVRFTLVGLPGTRLCGFFDDRAPERLSLVGEEPLLGPISEVSKVCRERRIDVIYVGCRSAPSPAWPACWLN